MDSASRTTVLALARQAHDVTEQAYRQNGAVRGQEGWDEKQRILLADMSLHLLQTALRDDDMSTDMLKRNLYAILTISEQFLPGMGLKAVADSLQST